MRLRRSSIVISILVALGTAWGQTYEDPHFLNAHLISGGVGQDGIPALTNPLFVTPDEVHYLQPDDLVMGVVIEGQARAYPHNFGWWNEIINDRFEARSIAVTFCPLTATGLVFDATDSDGSQIEFGVSGMLINSNLVMYDRRDGQTLYPQMIYTAINGGWLGERLELLPMVETTWAMWQLLYPETTVVQAGTGFDRYPDRQPQYTLERYTQYPYYHRTYGDYRTSDEFLLFRPTTNDGLLDSRLRVKAMVLGIQQGEHTRAYPFSEMPDGAVINDYVGETPLVVLFDAGSNTAIPYYRKVNGQLLSFHTVASQSELPLEYVDLETGSRWNMLGQAVAGPLQGSQLSQVPAYNAMWFAWAAYWPDTTIWSSGEGIVDVPSSVETATSATQPLEFALRQNVPNPFNSETVIHFDLPLSTRARLTIYNITGQPVRTLLDGYLDEGSYWRWWDGRNASGVAVASGRYLYRLELLDAGLRQTRAMLLVR